MRKLIITILLFASTFIFSQSRIGFTFKEIRDEFIEDGIQSLKTDLGNPYLALELKNFFVGYYFDEQYVCTSTKILPKNQIALNSMVQRYNDSYVIVSDDKWKMYSDKGICYISLVYEKDLVYILWE